MTSSRLFHPLISGSRMVVSLTCGPGQRSMLTGQSSIQARPKLGRLGLDTGWALARHVARAGAATSSYWATNGPWSTGAGEARFMVNLPALVHRPQSRSMKDWVHLLLPRVWFTCTMWSCSELGGATRDMVGEVMVDEVVVGATRDVVGEVVVGEVIVGAAWWSCSGHGRRGCGRRGRRGR